MLGALLLSAPLAFATAEKPETQQSYQPVEPTVEQARASILIARQLQFTHFREQDMNDNLSHKVFNSYLDDLDPQRLYLLQKDIEEFEPYRNLLDEAFNKGQLQPGFAMYNRYQTRVIERLQYVLSLLDKGIDNLDFTTEEFLKLDRAEEPWARDKEELDDIWRKRLKNAVLGMRLDGQDDDAIAKSLRRRYESQLGRVYQVRSEDAFQTWMNAFTEVWDPHTQYFSPRTSENFNINMSLSLEGIGAVLQSDNEYTKVVRLVPGGPAYKQGQLEPADRIVGVAQGADGEMQNVTGWRLDEVVDLIRGPKESTVRLQVIPANAADETRTQEIKIVRDEVKLEEQAAQSHTLKFDRDGKDWNVGVVNIPTFYADFRAMQAGDPNYKSTTRDVKKLIDKLKADGMDALVIDLRNNGGGALHEAKELVGLFIEEGPTVQVRNPNDDVKVLPDTDPMVAWDGPLMVLVNRMSASASEIFAGAIQDYGRGLIMGSQTFGKGTVQAVRPLNHGQLKITQSKFYRISGDSTQHRGVIPDIQIPSKIQSDEIGEDALEYALPWDQIKPVPHAQYFDFNPVLSSLREKHEQRFGDNPHYQLLLEEISLLDDQRNREVISLNEKERRQYQQDLESRRLAIINKRRKLDGEDGFENWQAYEDYQEEQRAQGDKDEAPDFLVRESGEIMADLLSLSPQFAQIDVTNKTAAVTP
ncbi:carboxy terminal-processing peptidase [Marinobacteraceae bacterium S3BR75-40.1]